MDKPLDAVDAEDAGPGGTTVVPGRAARRAKRAAEDADGVGEKAASTVRGVCSCIKTRKVQSLNVLLNEFLFL